MIASRPPNNDAGKTQDPPYFEGTGNWQNSSLKSTAPGLDGTRAGSRWCNSSEGAYFRITPTFPSAEGTYHVEVTHGGPNTASISADIICSVQVVGGTGLPETTDGFQRSKGDNAWYRVGTVTLDGTTESPSFTFAFLSGTIFVPPAARNDRFYMDGIRFVNVGDVCLTGLPQLTTVNGALEAGQTFVNVPGVDATATKVSVYAYDSGSGIYTPLGEKTTDIVAGVNSIDTTRLEKGQTIIASQTKDAIESCLATTGPIVGGGNPPLRVSLSVRDQAGLPQTVGADGGTAGTHLVFIKATGTVNAAFGVAPVGGQTIAPSRCWQTLIFDKNIDPMYGWSGASGPDAHNLPQDFGTIDALAFALEDPTDTGSHTVFVDNLVNGTTVIQDFDSSPDQTSAVMINLPSYSSSTTPYLLSPPPGSISPNISVTTESMRSSCLMLGWQFKDTSPQNWLRAAFQGSETPNPIIDLRRQTLIDVLILPLGESTPKWTAGLVESKSVGVGKSATFTVPLLSLSDATGVAYQWYHNGAPIENATGASVTLSNLQPEQNGTVTVTLTEGDCVVTRVATLTVSQIIQLAVTRSDNEIVISWDSSAGVTAALEKTDSLTAPITWVPAGGSATLEGANYVQRLPISTTASAEFFRLAVPQ